MVSPAWFAHRKNALGGELEYRYDVHGRLTRLINENKAEYKFAYDPLKSHWTHTQSG